MSATDKVKLDGLKNTVEISRVTLNSGATRYYYEGAECSVIKAGHIVILNGTIKTKVENSFSVTLFEGVPVAIRDPNNSDISINFGGIGHVLANDGDNYFVNIKITGGWDWVSIVPGRTLPAETYIEFWLTYITEE